MLGRLHLITDSRPGCVEPVQQVRRALAVATSDLVIQFRPADDWGDGVVYRQALAMAALGVTLLINDRVDVALAVGADGVHVGAEDLPVAVARRLIGGGILGATARDAVTAQRAVADGADYVGVGPCYRSSTKDGLPSPLGPSGVAAVAPHARVIAIGGVGLEHVPVLLEAGAYGVAVIAAVADAPDPASALGDLLKAVGS